MLGIFEGNGLETFLAYWCLHVALAPYLLFGLILLSGLNIPVGEEVLVVFGGVLAAHCAPQDTLWIWGWLYAGTLISAYETYFIGRFFGPQVERFALFQRLVDPPTLAKMGERIQKYGIFTFLVGRFFPGSVRNALFFTSGWTSLPFKTFVFRDGIGGFFSTTFFFLLGVELSEHAAVLFHDIALARHWLSILLALVLLSLLGSWMWQHYARR